jgi:hypothetical protein
LPIIGDEGVQRLVAVPKAKGVYPGINIKLMKSTGMREAQKMLQLARGLGMMVMLGCMTETSCGISAASHLSPMVDWADLDGALLISNDVFDGTTVVDGRIRITDRPGIGAVKQPGVWPGAATEPGLPAQDVGRLPDGDGAIVFRNVVRAGGAASHRTPRRVRRVIDVQRPIGRWCVEPCARPIQLSVPQHDPGQRGGQYLLLETRDRADGLAEGRIIQIQRRVLTIRRGTWRVHESEALRHHPCHACGGRCGNQVARTDVPEARITDQRVGHLRRVQRGWKVGQLMDDDVSVRLANDFEEPRLVEDIHDRRLHPESAKHGGLLRRTGRTDDGPPVTDEQSTERTPDRATRACDEDSSLHASIPFLGSRLCGSRIA